MGATAAAPRFVATLAVLVAIYVGATLYGGHDIITWLKGASAAPPSTPPAATPAAPAVPSRLEVTIYGLGRSPVSRFAFDPAVAGRVVACDAVSTDGGRTWPPLEPDPMRRAMILGGPRASAPAAGPEGRVLCGDVILPRPGGANGLDDIQIAAEWTGTAWRSSGLPVAAASGDTQLDAMVGYDAGGQPIAVRGDRLLTGSGEVGLPGRVDAFAVAADGALYGAIAPAGRRTALMWTPDPATAWTEVPSPGPVKVLAADGARVWAVADMLGRGTGAAWAWTRWPIEIVPQGVTGRGDVVVVWGGPKYSNAYSRGMLLISRDGGATLSYVSLERIRPTWVAIDPHWTNELLVIGDDQTLSRIRF